MQVLPGTGAVDVVATLGRPLNLHGLHDNVTAGVVLIRVLSAQTGPQHARSRPTTRASAGCGEHGMYPSTKPYVTNVVAIRQALDQGWNPA